MVLDRCGAFPAVASFWTRMILIAPFSLMMRIRWTGLDLTGVFSLWRTGSMFGDVVFSIAAPDAKALRVFVMLGTRERNLTIIRRYGDSDISRFLAYFYTRAMVACNNFNGKEPEKQQQINVKLGVTLLKLSRPILCDADRI